jgi:3-deoxy-7-phosphoheptulonate synthase
LIVILSGDSAASDQELVRVYLKDHGFSIREQYCGEAAVIGASGAGAADTGELERLPGVERAAAASRGTKAENRIVTVGNVKIGGSRLTVIAGPSAVESKEHIMETAACVREAGAVMLRGGAYLFRTSPRAFQGLEMRGLEFLKAAGEAYGMPVVTEAVSPELAVQIRELTDMFQIGSRNMRNFELLKKVGSLGKPVLLKRGPSAAIEEWLLSAEYLLASGAGDVVFCERGISTFETYTRNTLDISAIPVIQSLSCLPVIADPGGAVGIRALISSVSLAAVAAGADGLAVEVHPRPDQALSGGPWSLYPEQFEKLIRDMDALAPAVGKERLRTPGPRHADFGVKAGAKHQAAESRSGADLPVAFSGESGAYAEQALMRAFGDDAKRVGTNGFKAVFDAVLDGVAGAGVIPVENSLAGSVHENYDLFLRYPDIVITGELKLRIAHCLIAGEGADIDGIRVIRSHPQGFAQCGDFLEKHPDWTLEPYNNTATAVASIARDGVSHAAAIAGEAAAWAHGLKVIQKGIETNPLNYTRFAIISRRADGRARGELSAAPVPPGPGSGMPNKASLVFSIPDEPGSLCACLKILSDRGINLSKLESRPIQGKPWEYLFYADVSIPAAEVFEAAAVELETRTRDFHVIGAYRAAV